MKMLKDEKILKELKNKELFLTTHRIRNKTIDVGKEDVTSIMLEELCSCSFKYRVKIILLILGIFLDATGIYLYTAVSSSNDLVPWCIILGIIFIAAYFFSKKKILSFKSAGDSISLYVPDLNLESAIKFIDEVETAKNDRLLL